VVEAKVDERVKLRVVMEGEEADDDPRPALDAEP